MGKLFVTPAQLASYPIGVTMAGLINSLPPGTIDEILMRSSQRCEDFCQKRLQSPGSSTLSVPATAGQQSISVASTLTLDELAELAVIIDQGTGLQETVQITPGGVVANTPLASPYPGTITLETPLQFSHSSGAAVQYCIQEVEEAGSASSGDPYTEALQTQAAQLALAHLPAYHAGLTRIVFCKSYPIQTIFQIQHAYSFDVTYNQVPVSAAIIQPTAGYYRFQVGQVILFQGMMQTTYLGGYKAVPNPIKLATTYFVAHELSMFLQPVPVYSHTRGHQSQVLMQQGINAAVKEAETLLEPYRRMT